MPNQILHKKKGLSEKDSPQPKTKKKITLQKFHMPAGHLNYKYHP